MVITKNTVAYDISCTTHKRTCKLDGCYSEGMGRFYGVRGMNNPTLLETNILMIASYVFSNIIDDVFVVIVVVASAAAVSFAFVIYVVVIMIMAPLPLPSLQCAAVSSKGRAMQLRGQALVAAE